MTDSKTGGRAWAAKATKSTVHLAYWTAAWVVSTAVAAFGPRFIWDFATWPTIGAVVMNIGIGFGMIFATRRYLRGLDEMQQAIFLQASALTLGVGLVCGLGYEQLEDIRLIGFEPQISHLVILMCLTFVAGTIAGHRHYR